MADRRSAEDSPSPPVPADELQARLDAYNAASAAVVAAETAFRERGVVEPARLAHAAPGATLEPMGVRDIAVVAQGDTWAGTSTGTEQLMSKPLHPASWRLMQGRSTVTSRRLITGSRGFVSQRKKGQAITRSTLLP